MNREVSVGPHKLLVSGRTLTTARLSDEWYADLDHPDSYVRALRAGIPCADIFTLWQRPLSTATDLPYVRDDDSVALLPVSTYEHWLTRQINNKTRNLIKKATKSGVVVRPAVFDDTFVEGMVRIFNESPVRQGAPFWHYGKDFDTVKREFSRYLFRERLLGAYLQDELIGFIFLADAGRFAILGQIISMIRHRDKATNNALIAKAVETCADLGFPLLAYAFWPRSTLADFKRHNGFQPTAVPRYFVPLTAKGRVALRLGLHRGIAPRLPEPVYLQFKAFRAQLFEFRSRTFASTPK